MDAPSWPGVYRLSMCLMERLLKTLRYNFLTEALDFVGVHQERTLQVRGCQHCLGALRVIRGSGPFRTIQKLLSRDAGCASTAAFVGSGPVLPGEGQEQVGQVPDSARPLRLCPPSASVR